MRNPPVKKQPATKTQNEENKSNPPTCQASIASILSAVYVKTQEEPEPDLKIPEKNTNSSDTSKAQRTKLKYNSAKYVASIKLREEKNKSPPPPTDRTSKSLSDILASLNPNSLEDDTFFQPTPTPSTKKSTTLEEIYSPPKSASSSGYKTNKYSAQKRIQPAKYKRKHRYRHKSPPINTNDSTKNVILPEKSISVPDNALSSILADLASKYKLTEEGDNLENDPIEKIEDLTENAIVPLNLTDSTVNSKVMTDLDLTELDSIPVLKIENNKPNSRCDNKYRKNSNTEISESAKKTLAINQTESIKKTYNPKGVQSKIPSSRVPISNINRALNQKAPKSKLTAATSTSSDVITSNSEPVEEPKMPSSKETPPNPTTTFFELSMAPRLSRAVISFYCTSEFD